MYMDQEKNPFDKMKQSLMDRYQETFIRKLTRQDLAEFQTYLKDEFDPTKGWDLKSRLKFESKLRNYFHEEIIRREIASIEAVLELLKPEDLKT
jgi:DNA-binding MurR/RpiR family transcriptional regulator